jgi:hypothetical protein
MKWSDWEKTQEFAEISDIYWDSVFSVEHREKRIMLLAFDRGRQENSFWRSGVLNPTTKRALAKAWKHLYSDQFEWESLQRVQKEMIQLVREVYQYSEPERRQKIKKLVSYEKLLEMMIYEVVIEQMDFALDVLLRRPENTSSPTVPE